MKLLLKCNKLLLVTIALLTTYQIQLFAQETENISPNVELVGIQKPDKSIDLKASVKAKVNGKVRKMHSLKIHFFQISDSAETEIGSLNADNSGTAVLNVKPEVIVNNKDGLIKFKAVVNANKNMDEGSAEIGIKWAVLSITPETSEDAKSISLKLIDLTGGSETPVPNITIGIYVNRTFKPLKIAEGTTDENGEAVVDFPNDLPGDASGNLTVIAKIEEDENYGNLEASFIGEKWGSKVSFKHQELPRALWSSHPPLWMLITFIILMTAVWGHFIVIIFELFRLRKENPIQH